MIEALEREVGREERVRAFVREAIAAGKAIDAGADVYAADEVHACSTAWRATRAPRVQSRGASSLFHRRARQSQTRV